MTRPKIALYWCASCGGCDEAVVDLAEDILGLLATVDIVLWPVAMDFKKADVAALPDGALTATLLNGAIRSSEQEEMARLLRRKSRYLVAYGSCAWQGGIPGLANQSAREELMSFVYHDAPTVANDAAIRPQLRSRMNGNELELPELRHVVRTLDQVVPVDYHIPGCPPPPRLTRSAIAALLEDKLPPRGSVLAPDVALCDECPRRASKPTDLSYTEFKRPHQTPIAADKCLLAQGIVCLGPATRGGCDAACLSANMPCTGCGGPTSRVRDFGAKVLSTLAANIAARKDSEISRTLDGIPDPVGTFYRYSLPASPLRRRLDASAAVTPKAAVVPATEGSGASSPAHKPAS